MSEENEPALSIKNLQSFFDKFENHKKTYDIKNPEYKTYISFVQEIDEENYKK